MQSLFFKGAPANYLLMMQLQEIANQKKVKQTQGQALSQDGFKSQQLYLDQNLYPAYYPPLTKSSIKFLK
jgi:hypothetical protein